MECHPISLLNLLSNVNLFLIEVVANLCYNYINNIFKIGLIMSTLNKLECSKTQVIDSQSDKNSKTLTIRDSVVKTLIAGFEKATLEDKTEPLSASDTPVIDAPKTPEFRPLTRITFPRKIDQGYFEEFSPAKKQAASRLIKDQFKDQGVPLTPRKDKRIERLIAEASKPLNISEVRVINDPVIIVTRSVFRPMLVTAEKPFA